MCHASLCCLVLCKPFNDLFFFPQQVVFLIAGAKVRPFLLSGKLSTDFFSKKCGFSRILTRGGEHTLLYMGGGNRTVPPRRGTSPEGAEGVSRPQGRNDSFVCHAAAIMAVLFAMWVVTTLLCAMRNGNVGGKPLRPCGPPPLQGGGVPTMQQKFQGLEHPVSKPETLWMLHIS